MLRIRTLVWLCLLLLIGLSVPAVAAQDDMAALPDLGGRAVTVAVENAYPPFNELNADGVGVGWDYDTIREICRRLNCAPDFISASWEGMIVAVSNGEYDMAADGITITPDRAQIVDFSTGYAAIIQRLMVRLDENRFSNVDEFVAGDYLLGVQVATTNEITGTDLLGGDDSRIVGYSEFGGAVQALIAGDVDAVIIDDVAGMGFQGENADKIRLLPDVIKADQQLGFIFQPGSDLTAAFNAALATLVADGTLSNINGHWDMGPVLSDVKMDMPDLGGRAVTVAVENAYPPFNELNADGVGVGWDYDTIREICRRLNCAPDFISASWEGMIVAVSNGEYDMAADGITITPDRAQIVDFSTGYAAIIQRLMVRLDENRFSNVDEFVAGDYLLGVQVATTNEITGTDLLGGDDSRIVGYSEFGGAVQALIAGDVDAVIIDDVAGMGFQGENADKIRLLPDVIKADQQLGFIFQPGSDLTAAFNAALDYMIADGTLSNINGHWDMGPVSPMQ